MKAFVSGIGSRKFFPYKSLIVQPQKSPSLLTMEPFFPISVSRVLKPETKIKPESATVFVCPEPGCTKTFARFSDFELHLDVGEHVADSVNNPSGKVCKDSTKFNVKVFKYSIVQN